MRPFDEGDVAFDALCAGAVEDRAVADDEVVAVRHLHVSFNSWSGKRLTRLGAAVSALGVRGLTRSSSRILRGHAEGLGPDNVEPAARSWLVAMSGGKPLHDRGAHARSATPVPGRDGEASAVACHPVAGRGAQGGAARAWRCSTARPAHDIEIADILLPRRRRTPIAARTYKPRLPNRLVPTLVYFHMGGCVIGGLETCHVFCSMMAMRADCLVVSVEYRLAPEHKFPAAVEDALAAFRSVREHARSLGGNPNRGGGRRRFGRRLSGGGDRAGDEAVRTRSRRCCSCLIYPVVDWLSETASMKAFGDAYPLTTPIMDYFRNHYFTKPEEEALDLKASPGRAQDLERLAAGVHLHGRARSACRSGARLRRGVEGRGRAGDLSLLRSSGARVHGDERRDPRGAQGADRDHRRSEARDRMSRALVVRALSDDLSTLRLEERDVAARRRAAR